MVRVLEIYNLAKYLHVKLDFLAYVCGKKAWTNIPPTYYYGQKFQYLSKNYEAFFALSNQWKSNLDI